MNFGESWIDSVECCCEILSTDEYYVNNNMIMGVMLSYNYVVCWIF